VAGKLFSSVNARWTRIPTFATDLSMRSADSAAKLASILWGALGYLAKKRTKRNLITVGEETKVDVMITGTVGRCKIEEHVTGTLKLSPDQTTSTSTIDSDAIVAILLQHVPNKAFVMKQITETKETTKSLPVVTTEQRAEAKQFLTRLRSSTSKTKAGAMAFAIAGEATKSRRAKNE
jgi:hypothetical protein